MDTFAKSIRAIIGHAAHLDEEDLLLLACDPASNTHLFIDVSGRGPLRCLCAQHEWRDGGFTAIYYGPAYPEGGTSS